MQTIQLLREIIEVPCIKHGKPAYRWTNGYYVVDSEGSKIYPPVIRREALALARDIAGGKCKVKID